MKILVNGNTITEMVCGQVSKVREYKKVELVECDFYSREDVLLIDKFIGHIERNKVMYKRLVILITILINSSTITAYATGGLGDMAITIIDKLTYLAKYACMGMGIKEMIICLLNGGNMREASFAGIQFWIGYLFLEFYPTLYDFKF